MFLGSEVNSNIPYCLIFLQFVLIFPAQISLFINQSFSTHESSLNPIIIKDTVCFVVVIATLNK